MELVFEVVVYIKEICRESGRHEKKWIAREKDDKGICYVTLKKEIWSTADELFAY